MAVKRIVANIAAQDTGAAKRFYGDALGLDLLMDLGWIATYGTRSPGAQVSIASEGGSGAPVPDISTEADDVDAAFATMQRAGFKIEYGPVDEPWHVRRFFVRDPFGKLVNIVAHASARNEIA